MFVRATGGRLFKVCVVSTFATATLVEGTESVGNGSPVNVSGLVTRASTDAVIELEAASSSFVRVTARDSCGRTERALSD